MSVRDLPLPSTDVIDSISAYKIVELDKGTNYRRLVFVIYSHTRNSILNGWSQENEKTMRVSVEEGESLMKLSSLLILESIKFDEDLKFINVQFSGKKVVSILDVDKDLAVVCQIEEINA